MLPAAAMRSSLKFVKSARLEGAASSHAAVLCIFNHRHGIFVFPVPGGPARFSCRNIFSCCQMRATASHEPFSIIIGFGVVVGISIIIGASGITIVRICETTTVIV